jgi:hypothetical protein
MIKVSNNYKGLFYPDDVSELKEMISNYLAQAKKGEKIKGELKALIVPHAGYIYSAPVAAFSYIQLQGRNYERLVLIGPSHNELLNGFVGTKAPYWDHPFNGDPLKLKAIEPGKYIHINDEPFSQEHSLETQIPFISYLLPNIQLSPLIAGDVDDFKAAAMEIERVLDDKTLLIISSDLSHYHSYDQAVSIDKQTIQQILKLEPVIVPEQACGYAGINLVIELAKLKGWKAKLLNYRNSGDTAGNRSQVVGYCALAFYI